MFTKLKAVQQAIRRVTGQPYTLIGGCVRDSQWGVLPKDYDAAWCIGPDYSDAEAFAIIETHAMAFRDLGTAVTIYMAYGQGFNLESGEMLQQEVDRFTLAFYACIKVQMPNREEYDLLISRMDTVQGLVATHDCNINQVYLNCEGAPSQTMPDILEFAEDIRPERVAYMQSKFQSHKEA